MNKYKSNILKITIFATGLSGIVAEYILATLATYFLGNSVLQWTMTLSLMLFSMGIGSRLSKHIRGNLFMKFIIIEFILSLIVSFVSLIIYTLAGYTLYYGYIMYGINMLIGLLIGMEIPLVIRLNHQFEDLEINISSVMEKDYYGSLIGGLFFAFIGLPYLGLTYTPFVLGMINLTASFFLLLSIRKTINKKTYFSLTIASIAVFSILTIGVFIARPVVLYGEQRRYKDKIVWEQQSKYQKIVITQWKKDYWLFINGNQQLSTLDEALYHEPLVHPAMKLALLPKNILIMGGGDGCAAREVLKYSTVESITLVDLDPAMTLLAQRNDILIRLNKNALSNEKVKVINRDAFQFMADTREYYDVIIIDLPDPKTIELNRLYSHEFYQLCYRHLRPNGMLITQAGSPYYAPKAFYCIEKTLQSTGFNTLILHNQILTLGEWGWILATKNMKSDTMKKKAHHLMFKDLNTKWINQDAMLQMTSFGKNFYDPEAANVEVNRIHNPVLYQYYLDGIWNLY